MTKEERELLEPIVREIMGKSNRNITDDDLRKAMEQLNLFDEASAVTNYSYEHPDYGKMVGDMPDALQPLLNTDETHPDLPVVEDFMDSCAQLDRSTLVTGVNSIIYFWMDRWHTDPDGDVWMHPIHVAIMIAERFQLHECLPVLLETERQDRDFAVGDVMLLEAIIHCCLHTRNVDAKPMIIRMYSKYKLPNIFIPGGANEVRKNIKKADIGILKEELNSSETIWQNAATTFDEDDFDDGDYDHDCVAADFEESDDEIEYYEDEEWAPRQEYCGYAFGGKAKYLPVQKLKKYTLRIELVNSKPLIWRELEVPSSLCLTSLAQAILLAFGWNEDHLHQFLESRKSHYATSMNELGETLYPGTKDGSRYGVSHLLKKQGDSVLFEYDYGDSWYHKVKLKSVADYADYETKAVRLIGGANACPPDDCGGIYRYRHLVELMQKKPQSSELSEFYDWMGCKWDPEFFPMDETAKAVDKMNK